MRSPESFSAEINEGLMLGLEDRDAERLAEYIRARDSEVTEGLAVRAFADKSLQGLQRAVVGNWLRMQVDSPALRLMDKGIEAFIHSRSRCATCEHRRKDHDGPGGRCARYDDPDCTCKRFKTLLHE